MQAVLEPVDDGEVGVVLLLQLVHLAVQLRDLALQIRNHLKDQHVDMDMDRDEEMIQFGHVDLDTDLVLLDPLPDIFTCPRLLSQHLCKFCSCNIFFSGFDFSAFCFHKSCPDVLHLI